METTIKKLNEEQQVAFDLVRDTNRSFFLTGMLVPKIRQLNNNFYLYVA